MKKRIRIALFVICVVIGMNFLLIGCFRYAVDHRKTINESHNNAPVDDPIFDRLEVRCEEIESLYHALYESAEKTVPDSPWDDSCLSQSSIDSIEDLLYDAGYDVMDTNEPYPEYLTTSERFYVFWAAVQQNKDAEQEVITILKSGGLSYRV